MAAIFGKRKGTREATVIGSPMADKENKTAAIDMAIRRREDKATAMRIFKNMLQKLIDDGILSNGSSVDSQGSVRIPGESKRVDIFTFFPDDEQK